MTFEKIIIAFSMVRTHFAHGIVQSLRAPNQQHAHFHRGRLWRQLNPAKEDLPLRLVHGHLDRVTQHAGAESWSSLWYSKQGKQNICVSSMIPSSRSIVPPVAITILPWNLVCLQYFERWKLTDRDHCGPCVGRPSGSKRLQIVKISWV